MSLKKLIKGVRKQRSYMSRMSLEPSSYPSYLSCWFESRMGERLDLDNPRTLNQKIQWLKLYDSTKLKGYCADKYLVRNWISERIGDLNLVPLLGVWQDPDEIDFDLLPTRFVLKATHGSGWNVIVTDKDRLHQSAARNRLKKWLDLNYAFWHTGLELHYQYCQPRIICEEYLDFQHHGPIDYRFFCSYGEVFSVWEDVGSGTLEHKRNIYTPEWNLQDVCATWPRFESYGKPEMLDKMIQYSSILSRDFSFVRVDFYEYQRNVFFGEMTFTPMSGLAKFEPTAYDAYLGDFIKLPEAKTQG